MAGVAGSGVAADADVVAGRELHFAGLAARDLRAFGGHAVTALAELVAGRGAEAHRAERQAWVRRAIGFDATGPPADRTPLHRAGLELPLHAKGPGQARIIDQPGSDACP